MKLEERRNLHNMTIDQLQVELQRCERTMLDLRFDAGLNRLSSPAALHNTRKRIAVLKTIIREKELIAENGFATIDEYKVYKASERKSFKILRKAR